MKIREGFVSNSSSSSFVLVYDKNKHDLNEFKRVVENLPFGELYIYDSYKEYYSEEYGDDEWDELITSGNIDKETENSFVILINIGYGEAENVYYVCEKLKHLKKVLNFEYLD